eukprot:TRINITY_DN71324_c0_g1_i1.p1 TRINITY_DN71324_c0_g1~~TRINITY_DN71324_c0_g1_i1.p1  ORF type:complete len:330 (+),score=80.62 TRINITY_DN71324_c0_g1_i1:83-1072(+)
MATLRHRKPTDSKGQGDEHIQVEKAADDRRKRRRPKRCTGSCVLFFTMLLTPVLFMFGPRMLRYIKSSRASGYVSGWATPPAVLEKAAPLERDEVLEHFKTRCRYPFYPDAVRAAPRQSEFVRRHWVSARKAVLLIELGTAMWDSAASVSSKDSIIAKVRDVGTWVLHFAHSNRTEVEHHDHLEQVFEPADPLEAPFAEFSIPPSPGDIPGYLVPAHKTAPWEVSLVPALSGHSPMQVHEPFYLIVLAGRIRVIAYTPGYAFTIHDDHVWGWHENSLEKVRKSGNHGEMCFVETDQGVFLPGRWGYSFLALENSVLLKVPIDSGFKATE